MSRTRRGRGSRKTASSCLKARQLPQGIHHCPKVKVKVTKSKGCICVTVCSLFTTLLFTLFGISWHKHSVKLANLLDFVVFLNMPVYLTAKSLIVYISSIDTDAHCFASHCVKSSRTVLNKLIILFFLCLIQRVYLQSVCSFVVILADFNGIFNDRVAE